MAYENQIHCINCGVSIPDPGEFATRDMLLCDGCYETPETDMSNVKYGYWNEDPYFSLEDWKYEVANNDTRLGYHDWVKGRKEADEKI